MLQKYLDIKDQVGTDFYFFNQAIIISKQVKQLLKPTSKKTHVLGL